MEELVGIWAPLYQEVQERQKAYDARMYEAYQRRTDLAKMDVRFIFSPGDRVLLKQRERGKMKTRSTGPHVFVRYEGKLGTVAVVIVGTGRELKVSASNLLPVDGWMARQRDVAHVFPDPQPATSPGSPQQSTWGASSGDTVSLPPGVRVVPEPGEVYGPAAGAQQPRGMQGPSPALGGAEGPVVEGPVGQDGRLPWRDLARQGRGLRGARGQRGRPV